MIVVSGDFEQPFARDVPATNHVLEKRHDIVGLLGPAESNHEQRVIRGIGDHPASSPRSPREPHRPAAIFCAISPAMNPPLKPASMLTTVTFAAQLLSIPSRAAKPPKLAP